MAVPIPPPMQEQEALARSVMAKPLSPLQELVAMMFGRTMGERATNAFTGLAPLKLTALDPLAEALIPRAASHLENLFTRTIGSGWGKRIMQYLERHPREIKIGAESPGTMTAGASYEPIGKMYRGYAKMPTKIAVSPERAMEGEGGELLSHELLHALQDLSGQLETRAPGVAPTLRGRLDLATQYAEPERGAEILPFLASRRAKVTDPNAFRLFLEQLTPLR